jgi:hypothetical protein
MLKASTVVGLLSLCTGVIGWAASAAAEMLSGQEIALTIVGNTIEYDTGDGTRMVEYARPSGSFVTMNAETQEKLRGSWRIEGETICYDYFTNDPSYDACTRVYRVGPSQFKFFVTGGAPLGGDVTLQPGNPYGL